MENDPRWQPPMNGPYVSPGAGRPPAYAPYQRPAPPPVYGPPQPAYRPFVPPADNSCPMTATVCHRLNASQYDRVHRRTEKRALPVGLAIAAAVALLLFGYNAAVPFQLYTRDWQTLLFIGLEFLCLCAAVGMIPLLLHRRTVWRAKQFAAYMDSEPEESVIELYGDRAVQVSARGKTVIDYRLADFLLESADLIVLGGQGQVIAWRAEDMDPAGAQLVLACLTYMVRPAYFRRDGMFTPWLRQPLPVPVFSGGKEVWMTVSVDEEELQSFGGLYRQTMAGRFPYVLPVLLLLAGQLAMVFFLTPSILLDWAIYTGIVLAGAAGLSLLICGLLHTMGAAGTRTVQLAFTPSGLALRRGETVSFIDRRHIRAREVRKGVRLQTPFGRLEIPWHCVDSPATLKSILSL